MAIEIHTESGRCTPRVICEVCAEPIGDATKGNVIWYRDLYRELYFTHKRCSRDYKVADGYMWQPLDVFLLSRDARIVAIKGYPIIGKTAAVACAQNWRNGNEIVNGPYGTQCKADNKFNNSPGHPRGRSNYTGVNNESHTANFSNDKSKHPG